MGRRRELRPEERALWQRVRAEVLPLRTAPPSPGRAADPACDPASAAPRPGPVPAANGADRDDFLALFQRERPVNGTAGRVRLDLSPARAALLDPAGLDRRALARLRRGKLAPEGRIDLHGLTQAQAHLALSAFVLGGQAQGRRLLLVITGKGRAGGGWDSEAQGVLRAQVPRWLALPPLAPAVLRLAEAHVSHGGGGALYVWLRRSRG